LQFRTSNNKKLPETPYEVIDGNGPDADAANSQGSDRTPDVVLQQPITDRLSISENKR
jgi:hypothetical protein